MKMEQIECSETSAYNNQTPEKYPKEYIKNLSCSLAAFGCPYTAIRKQETFVARLRF
jgi:hypothetical protein